MKMNIKKALSAVSAAVIVSCSAAAVFPGLSASALQTVSPDSVSAAKYKNGYIYRGDVTMDGKIDSDDLNLLAIMAETQMKPDGLPEDVADLNFDGHILDDDVEILDDFLRSGFIYGDVDSSTESVALSDVFAVLNYLNYEISDTTSPFIDYIGDLFNRGDGLTEEDAMVLLTYINDPDEFEGEDLGPVMRTREYNIDFANHDIKKTDNYRYAGNTVLSTSVTLDGTLGLNFYVHLADETEYIILDGPNGTVTIEPGAIATLPTEGEGFASRTKITYPIAAAQASKNVSVRFEGHNNKPAALYSLKGKLIESGSFSSSVMDYVNNYISGDNSSLNALVAALGNYCKAAENYFCGTSNTVSGIDGITASNMQNASRSFAQNLSGSDISLALRSGTSLRIYYPESLDVTSATYSTDETASYDIMPKEKNGKKYLEIPDIAAQNLLRKYTVKVNGSSSVICPMHYAQLVLKHTDNPVKLQELAKALYVYANAAKNYNAN